MKVLVCLTADEPRPREALGAGAELAAELTGELRVILIQPAVRRKEDRTAALLALAREFTAGPWRIRTDDPGPALGNFVRLNRITHLVLGKQRKETGPRNCVSGK